MRRHYLIAVFVFASFSMTTHAITSIVPNFKKNKRELHSSPIGLGYSARQTAGVEFSTTKTDTDNATGTDSESEGNSVNPYLIYSNGQLGAELSYETGSEDQMADGQATQTTDTENLNLNLAGQLPTAPVVVGFQYENEKLEQTSSTVEDTSYGLGAGYRISENLLGGLYHQRETESETGEEDSENKTSFLGLGWVQGDWAKPELAGEVMVGHIDFDSSKSYVLIANILTNQGPVEWLAGLAYNRTDYDENLGSGDLIALVLGADIDIHQFYIAPSIFYFTFDGEYSDIAIDQTSLGGALESGLRLDNLAIFLRYQAQESESGYTDFTFNSESTTTGWTAGINYFF